MALSPVHENFRPAFSPDPTNCPWVSEDAPKIAVEKTGVMVVYSSRSPPVCLFVCLFLILPTFQLHFYDNS